MTIEGLPQSQGIGIAVWVELQTAKLQKLAVSPRAWCRCRSRAGA